MMTTAKQYSLCTYHFLVSLFSLSPSLFLSRIPFIFFFFFFCTLELIHRENIIAITNTFNFLQKQKQSLGCFRFSPNLDYKCLHFFRKRSCFGLQSALLSLFVRVCVCFFFSHRPNCKCKLCIHFAQFIIHRHCESISLFVQFFFCCCSFFFAYFFPMSRFLYFGVIASQQLKHAHIHLNMRLVKNQFISEQLFCVMLYYVVDISVSS